MKEEQTVQGGNTEPEIIRIDASWDNDRFLAEAETSTADGLTRYAVVTDTDGERLYRVLSASEYDARFCRTEGFMPGPEHELVRFESLQEASKAGCPWLTAFGRLDDLADVKDKLVDYSWFPEED